MESPGFQSGEARHGSAHLHARRRSGSFASEGAFEVQEEARAAGGGQYIWRGRRSKSQLSYYLSICYGKQKVAVNFLPRITWPVAACEIGILLERTPQNA